MCEQKSTRPDIGLRLELVGRRLEYLHGEITTMQKEVAGLEEEKNLLEQLQRVYADKKTDTIDEGRAQLEIELERKKPTSTKRSENSIQALILGLIESAGTVTANELIDVSGFSKSQVYAAGQRLVETNRVQRLAKGRYASLPKLCLVNEG